MSLFQRADEHEALVRPQRPDAAVPKIKPRDPTISGAPQMADVLRNVVTRKYMPSEESARIELMRRSDLPKDHPEHLRSIVLQGSWPVLDIVSSRIGIPHHAYQVVCRFDLSNPGSHAWNLQNTEPYGEWVPVAIDIRDGTEVMYGGDPHKGGTDGLEVANDRDLKALDPMVRPWDPDGEMVRYKPALESRETIEYAVLYVDAKGRQNVRRDQFGNILPETEVNVRTSHDPALAEAMGRQSEAIMMLALANSEKEKPEPSGDVAEMRAMMASMAAEIATLKGKAAEATPPKTTGK